MAETIVVIGAAGTIGQALVQALSAQYPDATCHAFSRQPVSQDKNIHAHPIDYEDETSIAQAAQIAAKEGAIDTIIVATGILHDTQTVPEKSLQSLNATALAHIYHINTVIPALIAKHFIPKLTKARPSYFAALSARVGSISDNRLGGWYAYRASKAALNMMLKNLAIETKRTNSHATIVGLHPGTVDSPLSKPFQSNVAPEKLFTPTYCAQQLINVLHSLTPAQSGRCFAWDGQEIKP